MPSVDLFLGPLIQCAEAATLGMPFEVWKTRMGRFRQEGTLEAFANIYSDKNAVCSMDPVGADGAVAAAKGGLITPMRGAVLGALVGYKLGGALG